jgi:hypothetical protein
MIVGVMFLVVRALSEYPWSCLDKVSTVTKDELIHSSLPSKFRSEIGVKPLSNFKTRLCILVSVSLK